MNLNMYMLLYGPLWWVPTTWLHRINVGLSDYRDSIHYRDSLRLFMNKIVDCLTIWIVIHTKFYKKFDKNFMKLEYKGNLTLMILDDCMSIMIFMN